MEWMKNPGWKFQPTNWFTLSINTVLRSCQESCRMNVRPVVGDMSGKRTGTWTNMACPHTRHSFSCTNKMTMARAHLGTWLNWLHYCCITSTFWWRTLEKVHPSWAQAAFKTSTAGVCSPVTHSRAALWLKMPWEWMEGAAPPSESLCYAVKDEVWIKRAAKSAATQKLYIRGNQATPPYLVLWPFRLHVGSSWCIHFKVDWPLRW